MTYTVYSHDAWGTTDVGRFPTLEQARALFEALQSDRWFLSDGSVKGLSIVDCSSGGAGRTLDSFSFARG